MTKKMKDEENRNLLVGYVRKSNAGGALKISIHNEAFQDCQTHLCRWRSIHLTSHWHESLASNLKR